MAKSLIETITERAILSFDMQRVRENWRPWLRHWFDEAEKYRKEFEAEGLVNTEQAVQNIIDSNYHLLNAEDKAYIEEKRKEEGND